MSYAKEGPGYGLSRIAEVRFGLSRGINQARRFTIKAANDTEECLARFHEIVEEAIERASEEGYEILPHRSSIDSKGRFDFALITEV